MIIGIMMYQMVAGALSKAPNLDQVDSDAAKMGLDGQCTAWKKSSWAIPPSDPQKLSDYAARINILSMEEWNDKELLSACDCAMYLYVNKLISRSDVEIVYDSDYCHEWANLQAENFNIGQ